MKHALLVLPFVLAACGTASTEPREGVVPAAARASATAGTCLAPVGDPRVLTEVARGFDATGYNRCARIFNGMLGGDHLVMKWNGEWDRGNLENWAKPPYAAWEDNEWNGNVPGGSGDVWHYKIKWVGPCGAAGATLADGGYCIWNQFEVIFSQGTSANQHFWDAHASPTGYGH